MATALTYRHPADRLLSSLSRREFTVHETENGYELRLVAPGLARDAITANLKGDRLEVAVGDAEYAWKLIDRVDRENISARYEAGIVYITLPFEAEEVTQIPVTFS